LYESRSSGRDDFVEGIIGEYAMVKKFGLEFYEMEERTAEAFCLILSIENLDQIRRNPPSRE